MASATSIGPLVKLQLDKTSSAIRSSNSRKLCRGVTSPTSSPAFGLEHDRLFANVVSKWRRATVSPSLDPPRDHIKLNRLQFA
jgi:hypothetical protein